MKNQNVTFNRKINKLINERLQEITYEVGSKAKVDLRDNLDRIHKHAIKETYTAIQISGQKVAEYNKDKYTTHKKKQPYHHSGLLLRSVHAVIDGDNVKIEIDDNHYDDTNQTSVRDVYEWLDKGTSDSEYDVYILGGKNSHTPYVGYVSTPKHDFRERTLIELDDYINNTFIPNIEKGVYLRKTRKGAK